MDGTTLNNVGLVLQRQGRPDTAMVLFRRALKLARAAGNRAGERVALNNLGSAFEDLSQPDSAFSYYSQPLAITREVGEPQ
jgi:Tfp pilus assembly protein PilF